VTLTSTSTRVCVASLTSFPWSVSASEIDVCLVPSIVSETWISWVCFDCDHHLGCDF
jgi:hypothetical protein